MKKKRTTAKSSLTKGADSAMKSGSSSRPATSGTAAVSSGKLAAGALTSSGESATARWTFLTNHSHVLILISRKPDVVLRHVATQVGITERAVQRIIADLEEAGILEREKVGRQNHYRILPDRPLRHAIESHRSIGDLLSLMAVDDH